MGLKQKEKLLSQKAKVKWALEGDENSRFFHGWINRRLKKNEIDGLKVGEWWVESVREVKEAVFNHFRLYYSSCSHPRLDMPPEFLS